MTASVDLSWLEAFSLALVRVTAFLVLAPPFSGGGVPVRVKALLAAGITIAVLPSLLPGYRTLDGGRFLIGLGVEAVTGAALGFLVLVVFSAVQSAGEAIDLFGGFQMAQAFDPQMMINGAQFARLFQMTALAIMFASGAYQLVFGGLIRSFSAVPLAAALPADRLAATLAQAVGEMVVAALQIAGPLILVLFLADAGLGLLSRVAPALNAFSMGFPVKILLVLLLGGTVVVVLPSVVDALTTGAVQTVLEVIG